MSRVEKLTYQTIYPKIYPHGKAKTPRSRISAIWRLIHYYEQNCLEDTQYQLRKAGLDKFYISRKLRELTEAKTSRSVLVTEVVTDNEGKPHKLDVHSLMDFEDNTTQLRATETVSGMLGMTEQVAGEDMMILYIHLPKGRFKKNARG